MCLDAQWGSELWTSLVFRSWILVQLLDGPFFKAMIWITNYLVHNSGHGLKYRLKIPLFKSLVAWLVTWKASCSPKIRSWLQLWTSKSLFFRCFCKLNVWCYLIGLPEITTILMWNCILQMLYADQRTLRAQSYIYKCYETIMFGWVPHTLDAAAMRVHSLFTSFTFCNISIVVLWYQKREYMLCYFPVFHWKRCLLRFTYINGGSNWILKKNCVCLTGFTQK